LPSSAAQTRKQAVVEHQDNRYAERARAVWTAVRDRLGLGWGAWL